MLRAWRNFPAQFDPEAACLVPSKKKKPATVYPVTALRPAPEHELAHRDDHRLGGRRWNHQGDILRLQLNGVPPHRHAHCLAISLGFGSGRALAADTAWAGLCLIHHHHHLRRRQSRGPSRRPSRRPSCRPGFRPR